MKAITRLLLALLAFGTVGLVSCGGDDSKEGNETDSTQSEMAPPSNAPATSNGSKTTSTETTKKDGNPVIDASRKVREGAKEVQRTAKDVEKTKKEANDAVNDVKDVFKKDTK